MGSVAGGGPQPQRRGPPPLPHKTHYRNLLEAWGTSALQARSPGRLTRHGQHDQADPCHWPPPEDPLGASVGSASPRSQLSSSAVAVCACGSFSVLVVYLW